MTIFSQLLTNGLEDDAPHAPSECAKLPVTAAPTMMMCVIIGSGHEGSYAQILPPLRPEANSKTSPLNLTTAGHKGGAPHTTTKVANLIGTVVPTITLRANIGSGHEGGHT